MEQSEVKLKYNGVKDGEEHSAAQRFIPCSKGITNAREGFNGVWRRQAGVGPVKSRTARTRRSIWLK